MNNKSKQIAFKMDLHLLIPPEEVKNLNLLSLYQNNNKDLFLKKEYSKSNTFFNTFSSKANTNENKSQKIFDKNIIDNKLRRIKKTKSANYKNIQSFIEEEKKKNSYLYLMKLKKYYSMQNFVNNNKSKYNSHISNNNPQKIKSRISKDNEVKSTNNYYTINNFFINSKLGMNIDSNTSTKNFYNQNMLSRNISNSYSNKTNEIKNDISKIINTRKKFNEIYNHFYDLNKKNINEDIKSINTNNNTSKYSSMNEYWNKRNKENNKKITKLKNELIEKAKNDIKSVPKINNKSKELAKKSNKNKNDNLKCINVFEKLFQKKILAHSHTYKKRINNKPKINEKSEKMIRTIDDLYLWNNKRQKKIKDNANEIYKKDNFKNKNINLTSEIILKERRPFYTNKKVEDRLIEQGQYQKIKKNRKKEIYIKELTEQKIYKINNYNKKIKRRYMLPEERKNEGKKNNSNIKKNRKLFNFNYDYNITTFNKRSALFDKNKSNIIMELSEKIDKNKIFLDHSKTFLFQNYMKSKINENKNNVKIKGDIIDLNNNVNKDENNIQEKKETRIEELKLGLINNNNHIKNQFLLNKSSHRSNSLDRIKEEKRENDIFEIKDKRLEDIKKIIDFSDKLY